MEDKNIRNEFGNFAPKPEAPKKLYDFKNIALGLLIFFGLIFSPVILSHGKLAAPPDPKLDTPAIQKLAAKDRKCVMPTDWMRANHMQMLVEWREAVVRSKGVGGGPVDDRMFVNPDG